MPPIPSTSGLTTENPIIDETTSTTIITNTIIPRRRHHRIRQQETDEETFESIVNVLNINDTILSKPPPPHLRKNQLDERTRNIPYSTNLLSKNHQQIDNNSLAGVFILIFVLIGIIIVLILFYFLAKVCNSPQNNNKRKLKTKNGTIIIRDQKQSIEVIPTKVPLPKRIYELKAEEGYYSCPPSLDNNLNEIFGDSDDDCFSDIPSSPQHETTSKSKNEQNKTLQKPANNDLCVRKITGAGIPPGFKPKGRLQELINS